MRVGVSFTAAERNGAGVARVTAMHLRGQALHLPRLITRALAGVRRLIELLSPGNHRPTAPTLTKTNNCRQ